jgi:hypothetical protein
MIAMQQGNFWTHDASGSDEVVKRTTQAGVEVDTVDTRVDLGFEINMKDGAIDPQSDELWLFGFAKDSRLNSFLRVDTSSEPDVLIEAIDFDLPLDSMTHDGVNIWALNDGNVLKIDPITFQVVETYGIRLAESGIVKLTSYQGRIYVLLVSRDTDTTSIIELEEGGPIVPMGLDPTGAIPD